MGWRLLAVLLVAVLACSAVQGELIITPSDINTCSNSCKPYNVVYMLYMRGPNAAECCCDMQIMIARILGRILAASSAHLLLV